MNVSYRCVTARALLHVKDCLPKDVPSSPAADMASPQNPRGLRYDSPTGAHHMASFPTTETSDIKASAESCGLHGTAAYSVATPATEAFRALDPLKPDGPLCGPLCGSKK